MHFDDLSETLLRGGIAPKHVRRYIAELRDHADDLTRSGASPEAALAQLGTQDALAAEMLAREDLKTLGARYPVPFYGAGPAVALLTSYVLAVLVIGACIWVLNLTIGKAAIISSRNLHEIGQAYCWFVGNGLPILVGLGFVATAIRQRTHPNWLMVGVALISFVGACANMSVIPPPDMASPGELEFGFGFSAPPFPGLGPTLQHGLLNLALIAPALAWLLVVRRRHGATLNLPR